MAPIERLDLLIARELAPADLLTPLANGFLLGARQAVRPNLRRLNSGTRLVKARRQQKAKPLPLARGKLQCLLSDNFYALAS